MSAMLLMTTQLSSTYIDSLAWHGVRTASNPATEPGTDIIASTCSSCQASRYFGLESKQKAHPSKPISKPPIGIHEDSISPSNQSSLVAI